MVYSCCIFESGARFSAIRLPFTVYRPSHGGEGLKRLDLEALASSSFRILTLGAGLKRLDFEVLSFGSTRKIVISS